MKKLSKNYVSIINYRLPVYNNNKLNHFKKLLLHINISFQESDKGTNHFIYINRQRIISFKIR